VQFTRDSNRTLGVVLHRDRETYSVGESIRPKLELRNRSGSALEISGFEFDWDVLAYSDPNAAYLIAPDGQNKLLPYRRSGSFPSPVSPLRVEAERTEWCYLPISHHLHLRQFGHYVFWLDLQDNIGELHRSNKIEFDLVDEKASVPPELLQLRLSATKHAFSRGESVEVEAVFTNKSDQRITILRPQEDSFDGWVNPIYQFTVVDSEGRSLALARRSGSMASPFYDETTKVALGPGHSHTMRLRLPDFPQMRNPGEYRVRLTYLVREMATGKGGDVLERPMNWEEGVFTGRIESNELVIKIQ
jgi:hypothetical protein